MHDACELAGIHITSYQHTLNISVHAHEGGYKKWKFAPNVLENRPYNPQ